MCIYICELFWHRGLKAFCTGCTEGIAVNPFCEPVFPICRLRSFVFSLVAAAFWIPASTHGSRRKKQCCAKYTNLKSDFWRDFLAYCTRPVSVHFGNGVCQLLVWRFLNLFAQFKATTKSHENYVFLYPFSNMAISMMKWCLMSSDVRWHIRDKLRPMPKHGSINLYVHGSQKAR